MSDLGWHQKMLNAWLKKHRYDNTFDNDFPKKMIFPEAFYAHKADRKSCDKTAPNMSCYQLIQL